MAANATDDEQLFAQACAKFERDWQIQTHSGIHGPFTDEQRQQCRHVFSQLADIMPINDIHKQSDCDLIYRFLIARKWDASAVVSNMREYSEWRRREKIDEILWEQMPADLQDGIGATFRGFSKAGRPIGYIKPTPAKIAALLEKYPVQRLIRRNFQTLEAARRLMVFSGADRMVQIMDLSEMGISILRNPSAIGALRDIAKITQRYIPECLLTMYLANGGYLVTMGLAIASKFLDERTMKKVVDIGSGSEAMSKALAEHIDLSEVSPEFGGTGPPTAPLHPALGECVDSTVPKGTPPMRPQGFRGDFAPPPSTAAVSAAAAASGPLDNAATTVLSVGSLAAVAGVADPVVQRTNSSLRREDSMVSAESGDLDEADLVIESPQRAAAACAAGGVAIEENGNNNGEGIGFVFEGLRQQHQQSQPQQTNNSEESSSSSPVRAVLPLAAPPAPSSLLLGSGSTLAPMMTSSPSFSLPARCVHLFVRLKAGQFQTEQRITARTEFCKRGGTSAPPVSTPAQVASTLQRTGAFFTIGQKVLSSSSGGGGGGPVCVAETLSEAGQILRRHLIVIDERRKIHFVLQRGALHNEIRVLRPGSGAPTVDLDRCAVRGPEERTIMARIMPEGNRGGWVALQELSAEEAAEAAAIAASASSASPASLAAAARKAANSESSSAASQTPPVLARCKEIVVANIGADVATELFQVPKNYKFERGALPNTARTTTTELAYHRHVMFEGGAFVSSPPSVLAALVTAVDALFLESE